MSKDPYIPAIRTDFVDKHPHHFGKVRIDGVDVWLPFEPPDCPPDIFDSEQLWPYFRAWAKKQIKEKGKLWDQQDVPPQQQK